MRNLLTGIFCLSLLISSALAQNAPLQIQGTSGKFYLIHSVAAKENWYSIGRLYNASPHDLATYNNMSFDKPLDIGQQINIPLETSNFDQRQKKGSGETLIPVYHTVLEKEWAFKLSSLYNDLPVSSLEKWNKIKRDDVKPGMTLIIGYLKVKTDQSPFALTPPPMPGDQPIPATVIAEKPKEVKAAEPAATTSPASTVKAGSTVPATTVSTGSAERQNLYAAAHAAAGGFFSGNYLGSSNKSFNGQAGTFKSTSGWTDGKYYALMNGVPVGTIIRVNSNGKTVYAKILGQLPEMKESNGLIIRISNAAADELGAGEGRFAADVRY